MKCLFSIPQKLKVNATLKCIAHVWKVDGTTALHSAALNGDVKIVRLLMTYGGVSVSAKNKNGKTFFYNSNE